MYGSSMTSSFLMADSFERSLGYTKIEFFFSVSEDNFFSKMPITPIFLYGIVMHALINARFVTMQFLKLIVF